MIKNYQWPKGWRGYVLTEGVEDIGLPEYTVKRIKESMPEADPAAQTYIGNLWKASQVYAGFGPQRMHDVVNPLRVLIAYIIGPASRDEEAEKRLVQYEETLSKLLKSTEPIAATAANDYTSDGYRRGKLKKDMKTVRKIAKGMRNIASSLDLSTEKWQKMEPYFEEIESAIPEAIKYTTERFLANERIEKLLRFLNFRKDNWRVIQTYYRGGWKKYAIHKLDAEYLRDAMDPNERAYNRFLTSDDSAVRNNARNEIRQRAKEDVEISSYAKKIAKAKGLPDPIDDVEFSKFLSYQNDLDAEEAKTMIKFDADSSGIEYYWVDLDTHNCPIEASRMGHCGAAQSGGTVYSLRYKEPGQRLSKSVVTIEYSEDEDTVYQIKGKGNTIPPEQYWPYITEFLQETDGPTVVETGEHSGQGHDEWREFLEEVTDGTSSSLDNSRSEFEAVVRQIENGDHNTDEVTLDVHYEDYGDEPYASLGGSVKIPFVIETPRKNAGDDLFDALDDDGFRESFTNTIEAFVDRHEDMFGFDNYDGYGISDFINQIDSIHQRRYAIKQHGENNYSIQMPIAKDEDYYYSAEALRDAAEQVAYDLNEDTVAELGAYLSDRMRLITPKGEAGLQNIKFLMQGLQKLEKESENLMFDLEEDYDWEDYDDVQREMIDDEMSFTVTFLTYLPLYIFPSNTDKYSFAAGQRLKLLAGYPMDIAKEETIAAALETAKKVQLAKAKQLSLPGMDNPNAKVELRKPSNPRWEVRLVDTGVNAGNVKYTIRFDIGINATSLTFTKDDVWGILKYFKILDQYLLQSIEDVVKRVLKRDIDSVVALDPAFINLVKKSGVKLSPEYFSAGAINTFDKSEVDLREGKVPRRKIKIRMRRK
jgi:hypothetical protein